MTWIPCSVGESLYARGAASQRWTEASARAMMGQAGRDSVGPSEETDGRIGYALGVMENVQHMKKIEFHKATKDSSSRYASWARTEDRFGDECWPRISPEFVVDSGATVFTIGSCFAQNIQKQLGRLGYSVPALDFPKSGKGWKMNPGGVLTKYTPATIFQELAWGAKIFERDGVVRAEDCEQFAYDVKGGVVDNNLADFRTVTEDAFLDRRRAVYESIKTAFEADVVVITLGMTESWYDVERDLYLHGAPHTNAELRKEPSRFCFVRLDIATCKELLEQTLQTVRRLNPKAKFLITTSPVPMNRTFTEDDVIVANCHSKSILRAVCGEVAIEQSDTAYFPSYESVTMTRSWAPWAADRRHVVESFVAKIVTTLCQTYFSPAGEAEQHYQASFSTAFNEEGILAAFAMIRLALELEPSNPQFLLRQGSLLTLLGRHDEAEAVIGGVIETDPTSADAFVGRALVREGRGDLAGAAQDCEAAIAIAPHEIRSLSMLGALQLRERRLAEAEETFRTLIGRQPKNATNHVSLGIALRGQKRFVEAVAAIEGGITHPRENLKVLKELGHTLAAAGRPAEAHAVYSTALKINPEHEGLRAARAALKLDPASES